MSREFKFRIWDQRIPGSIMSYDDGHFSISANGEVFCVNDDVSIENDSFLMQYTGLKDKNGVEIYEGDIVRCYYFTRTRFDAVVKFGEYAQDGSGGEYSPNDCIGFYAEAINPNQKDEDGFRVIRDELVTSSLFDFSVIKVIGNIYEHPHLLKGGEPDANPAT